MLLFCEDCGQKNIIDPEKVRSENNQYRCQVCNFLNTISGIPEKPAPKSLERRAPQQDISKKEVREPNLKEISKPEPHNKATPLATRSNNRKIYNIKEEPYTRVFQKIASNKNILGAYIFHFSNDIIACDVDEELSDEKMIQLGKALAVCCPAGHKTLRGTKEIYLVLDNLIAVSRSITMNSILIFICNTYPVPQDVITTLNNSVNNLQVFI